jgi:hypothetical protein
VTSAKGPHAVPIPNTTVAAPAGKECNWITTIPGQGFSATFRLNGSLEPALDGTWKLDDFEIEPN